jgi:hypothetical protein
MIRCVRQVMRSLERPQRSLTDTDFAIRNMEGSMGTCPALSLEMLPNRVDVSVEDRPLDFSVARTAAQEAALTRASEPLLLAWLDAESGQFSPNVTCCGDDKPTWLVYAESRGGDLSISVNGGRFIFVFATAGSEYPHQIPPSLH